MSNRLKRRQEIELQIEKVAFGGKGIAYVDEYVVFVDECLPGDRLIARGLPTSFHAIANDRMARFNAAYAAIERELRAA